MHGKSFVGHLAANLYYIMRYGDHTRPSDYFFSCEVQKGRKPKKVVRRCFQPAMGTRIVRSVAMATGFSRDEGRGTECSP